jgi:hypothetical protein
MDPVVLKTENRVKKFVRQHKVAITFTATSLAWIAINQMALRQHDAFLREHGLFDEFYLSEG